VPDVASDIRNLVVDPRHVVDAQAEEYGAIIASLVRQNAQYVVAISNLTADKRELEAKVAALITGPPTQRPAPDAPASQ
jgi:hypothetical protein